MIPAWLVAASAVAVGSGAGGLLRWIVSRRLPAWWASGAPAWAPLAATWTVNVLGSAALAAIATTAQRRGVAIDAPGRLFWTTGVMGGLTTYSTFNFELWTLLQQGRVAAAVGYAAATAITCLAGAVAGWWLFRGGS